MRWLGRIRQIEDGEGFAGGRATLVDRNGLPLESKTSNSAGDYDFRRAGFAGEERVTIEAGGRTLVQSGKAAPSAGALSLLELPIFARCLGDGVVPDGGLSVAAVGSDLVVQPGYALVGGLPFALYAETALSPASEPSVGELPYSLFIRTAIDPAASDWGTARLVLDYSSSGYYPSMARTATTREVRLANADRARGSWTRVLDARTYLGGGAGSGWSFVGARRDAKTYHDGSSGATPQTTTFNFFFDVEQDGSYDLAARAYCQYTGSAELAIREDGGTSGGWRSRYDAAGVRLALDLAGRTYQPGVGSAVRINYRNASNFTLRSVHWRVLARRR